MNKTKSVKIRDRIAASAKLMPYDQAEEYVATLLETLPNIHSDEPQTRQALIAKIADRKRREGGSRCSRALRQKGVYR